MAAGAIGSTKPSWLTSSEKPSRATWTGLTRATGPALWAEGAAVAAAAKAERAMTDFIFAVEEVMRF